jgi:pilus retraction protein PilT
MVQGGVVQGVTDLHITGGHPVVYRRHGKIAFDKKNSFSHAEVDGLIHGLLTAKQEEELRNKWSIDFATTISRVRLRVNIFRTTRGLSMAVRLLPGFIPTIEELNLYPGLKNICRLSEGLILICGPTGCGKTTTIASLINEINKTRGLHVITLEDPIEYRFASEQSFIQQRELDTHVQSFEQGLIDVLREDPNVIVVGELREPETIRLALNAAESGHLVIATLHATNVEDAIYRICNSFSLSVQEFVRFQLSSALAYVVVQQLVFMERIGFSVPVLSIMSATTAVKGSIRENKIHQLENVLHMSRSEGMFSRQRYVEEYLDGVKKFFPPSAIFKPTPESDPDRYFDLAAFDRRHVPRPQPQPGAEVAKAPKGKAGGVVVPADSGADWTPAIDYHESEKDGGEGTYKIDAGEDLADVLKDLTGNES